MTDPIKLTGESLIVQCADMPHGEIDDELMALDAAKGEVLGVDPVGTWIWKLSASSITVDELTRRLGEEYDADQSTIANDVRPFLIEMVESGLLRIVS